MGDILDARKNRISLTYGITGIGLQVVGCAFSIVAQDIDPVVALIGVAGLWIGAGLLVVGLGYYASAKGHHWAWGLVGLLSIIGLLILAALPDRHGRREEMGKLQADATKTARHGRPVFHCIKCNYIISGCTTGMCPECGHPFDGQDPTTMRVADEHGGDWFANQAPPWTARWSLILGILSLVMFCLPCFGLLFPIAGVVCGHHARRVTRGRHELSRSAGVALAGLITSYIGLGLTLVSTAWLIIIAILEA